MILRFNLNFVYQTMCKSARLTIYMSLDSTPENFPFSESRRPRQSLRLCTNSNFSPSRVRRAMMPSLSFGLWYGRPCSTDIRISSDIQPCLAVSTAHVPRQPSMLYEMGDLHNGNARPAPWTIFLSREKFSACINSPWEITP